ncbi:unnamed protein product, partial [Natator depressus]
APALPGDVPGAVYDDARGLSVPEGDPGLGQNDEKGTEASDRDAQIGGSLHSRRSEGVSGMEKETLFLPLGDTGYDDVGIVTLGDQYQNNVIGQNNLVLM